VVSANLLPGSLYALKAAAVFAGILAIVRLFARAHHPFPTFGPANQVTTIRAALVALVAGLIGEPHLPAYATAAAVVSGIVTALDGVDGWLARRTRMASRLGARFDMEVDALLILVLSILAWQYGKAGAWIVLAGLLRYVFVAAGWVLGWMARPLFPSRRRQAVCVIQIIGSSILMLPPVAPPASIWMAATLLAALSASFLVDVMWLWRARHCENHLSSHGSTGWLALVASLLVLNAAVTFHNIWPTPAVGWSGEISLELAVLLLLGIFIHQVARRLPSPGVRRALAAFWLILTIGRYVDVTAPALWGRSINLYWDLQFVPDVAAMLARAARLPLVIAASAGVVLLFVLVFIILNRSLTVVLAAIGRARERRALMVLATAVVVVFLAQQLSARAPKLATFPTPVTQTYGKQVQFVVSAMHGARSLPASPSFDANLSRVAGADVLLFFIESYGAVVYERPQFSSQVTQAREALDRAIHASGHEVVSALVESPTFGGSSWYAHLTLLSGIDVRDPDTNALLMTAHRDTVPTAFARHGYRTVAMMPGVWYPWPEGAFYGFTDTYNGARLNYRGPSFGWWSMSDQFVLAALDANERRQPGRPPLFVFFPTISTHTPFAPTPPYQPNWARMLTRTPYDPAELDAAYATYPDWLNLTPSYLAAVSYSYRTLAGYLLQHPGEDFVMVLIGDHEPPALVSGPNTLWDVPVHVIAKRRDVLDRLQSRGFRPGLTPQRPSLGKMHTLTPLLLDAFSN
jgi:phosphatidylglycerophosphate synthase